MAERMQGDVVAAFESAIHDVDTAMLASEQFMTKMVNLKHGLVTMRRSLLEDLRGVTAVLRDDGEPR